jgi:mono/diheme cytochrome c family protein
MLRQISNLLVSAAILSAAARLLAAPAAETHFAQKVLPLLKEKCLACHGDDEKKIKGKFDMRTASAFARGGESGEAPVVPGKPEDSPLFKAVTRVDDETAMPPKENDNLTEAQTAIIREWIAAGAPWPDEKRIAELAKPAPASGAGKWDAAEGVIVKTSGGLSPDWTGRKYKTENLWAYQPLARPRIPAAGGDDGKMKQRAGGIADSALSPHPSVFSSNPIDAFLDAKMRELGVTPASRADRATLIRRATYDLHGLPPAPSEVEAFLNDRDPDDKAFGKVVERLLASPRYGEQWGRHWLDVVRYADSSGFANDFERGNAWRYRDYVIRSFNDDKPYDRFIREQVAGDELDPNNPEMLVAAGFLRSGPWELTGMEVAKVARQRFLDDVTDLVGQTFLSNTLQCCRCHDHKFDPIPTRDYYSFQACFATTQLVERPAAFLPQENVSGFDEAKFIRQRQAEHLATLAEIDEKSVVAARAWFAEKKLDPTAFEKALEEAGQAKAARKPGKKTRKGGSDEARALLLQRGVPENQLPPKQVGFTTEDYGRERVARKGLERLAWELDRYQPFAFSVYNGRTADVKAVVSPQRMPADRMNNGELEETCILAGGDPFSPKDQVKPGVLSVLEGAGNATGAVLPADIDGRRTALAAWIASPGNPLTSRSIVNRIWQWHFGEAIAGNPNNFGATGKKPTHPELLDWLAAEFVNRGWSFKEMHRLVMSSEAYRRKAEGGRTRDESEPGSAFLAQPASFQESYAVFKPRRLTAEELRDSMLAASGELNLAMGGIPARPEINLEAALQPRQVMGTFAAAWQPNPLPSQRHRRSIYALKIRGLRDPFMEVFNEPSPEFSCEARDASNVTPQVFSMFNGEASYDRAVALALRVQKESPGDKAGAISRACHLVLGHAPSQEQSAAFLKHWEAMTARHASLKVETPAQPAEVIREAVEENTGEKFAFREKLPVSEEFVRDKKMSDVDAATRGLAELCLVLFNSSEFSFVY